jgi:TolB-like protein/Flp pilus assembly protein TadD
VRYLFQHCTLDTDRRELRRGADLIAVPPQVFDLLAYLIRNRERVVSKDDIISAIWNDRIVSDAALTTRVNAARTAIGDSGEKQHLIKTLPRKGFRFVGAVHEDEGGAVAAAHGSSDTSPLASAPRLSIVVLPFANIGGDAKQDYFADGVTESLTTDLSRISGSSVIGRHTAFTYRGKPIDLKQIGLELNIRYVLQGSVQRVGDRLRVNVQLVSAETGNQLWAERFDKPVTDLFDMQDEIVARLANALDARLTEEEARRSSRSPHPDSMDLYFQGKASFNKGWTPEYIAQARDFFDRALVLDSENIEAMVGIAAAEAVTGAGFLHDHRAEHLAAAEATAVRVLSIAPNHAWAHVILGMILISTNRIVQGAAECERALTLDRNLAEARAQIGGSRYFLGRAAETEIHMNEALRLSPRDINAFRWLMVTGFSKFQLAADTEALNWLLRSLEANRNYPLTHFGLAAALALLGSDEQARAAAMAGLALDPGFTVRRFRDGASSDNAIYLAERERVYEGMRLAGVPEG